MVRAVRRAVLGAVGRRLPAVLASLTLAGQAWAAGPAPLPAEAPHAATRAAMAAVVRAGVPGVVARTRTDKRVWGAAAGTAALTPSGPPRQRGRFRIGSITKTFVATVVLQLEAEHRLRLSEPVERRLPGVVRGNGYDGRRITVRQLLNHTSGIFDYTDDPALRRLSERDVPAHRFAVHTPSWLVATALAHRPLFAPGRGWSYSNTNYLLAGMVVERVTGHPYAEEIERRILRPLHLRATSLPGRSSALPRPMGRGYVRLPSEGGGSALHDVTALSPTAAGAAGEMISTTGDLDAFLRALLGGRLLPRRQLAEMLTTVDTHTEGAGRYGLGIGERRLSCGVTLWGHDGAVPGWLSAVGITRDGRRSAVFVLDALGVVRGARPLFEAEFCGG
ncbi:serine hydrolase domain-containing protein [Streptomyces sp. NPDC049555]|uniref:serine hydrolase domain-containing protein n=1 Tax=Streptomyces sp. NPDC049555 TaxID=3154930 RepID=UPI003441600F